MNDVWTKMPKCLVHFIWQSLSGKMLTNWWSYWWQSDIRSPTMRWSPVFSWFCYISICSSIATKKKIKAEKNGREWLEYLIDKDREKQGYKKISDQTKQRNQTRGGQTWTTACNTLLRWRSVTQAVCTRWLSEIGLPRHARAILLLRDKGRESMPMTKHGKCR